MPTFVGSQTKHNQWSALRYTPLNNRTEKQKKKTQKL